MLVSGQIYLDHCFGFGYSGGYTYFVQRGSTVAKLNQLTASDFFMGRQTWYFILNVIICHFSGDGMVKWTITHCFDFFTCNLMYIVSI